MTAELKKLTCIVCPMGCELQVDEKKKIVTGHTCKRGEIYGIEEVTHPTRVITTTVKLAKSIYPMLPVKTNGAIPKDLNFKCMAILNQVEWRAPVKLGDIIVKDLLGTGIDVVATRTMGLKK
ncbi:MAG: hypothetical protein K0S71_194 [Clostridia bacterium]|jgi:CxxC motif-containing protein|nr:hypothetical protein [Clostridia bacterium]